MIYDEFKLPDDHTVVFCDLIEDDVPQLMSVYNSIVEEGKYFLRNRGPSSVEEAREWLQQHLQAGLTYVAVKVNGELAGGATIEPREDKASHVAYFGIFLKKEFRNLGIGTRLTRKMVELSREKGFEIIQLYVFALNTQAIHLYKKMGFTEVGRIKKGVKFADGTYTDEIIMIAQLR
jgi:RimJ/RimL family protein N-acetyltransferase